MARFGSGSGGGGVLVESDPVAAARLDALGLTFATDAELAAAADALQAADALKQDAATAATDAEVAAARAAVEAAMATDAELASAVAALQVADTAALTLTPGTAARNLMQPTGDVDVLTIRRNPAGNNGSFLRLQQADGKDLFKFDDNRLRIYKGDGVAPSIQLVTNPTVGAVIGWEVGIDVGAPVSDRDFYIAKMLPGGGVRDFLYCNHNGGNAEPTLNIGRSPGDSDFRVTVATDQGTPTMGGLKVYQSSANTGLAFAVVDWSDVVRFSAQTDGKVTLRHGTAKLAITGANLTSTPVLGFNVSGDADERFNVTANGELRWGSGAAAPTEITLGRGAANRLDLKGGEIRAFAASGSPVFVSAVTGDANRRWQVRSNGEQLWGDGAAGPDVLVSRTATNRLHVGQNAANEVIVGGSAGKVGFYGAAPAAKQVLAAVATDAASTQTLANSIRSLLVAVGMA